MFDIYLAVVLGFAALVLIFMIADTLRADDRLAFALIISSMTILQYAAGAM